MVAVNVIAPFRLSHLWRDALKASPPSWSETPVYGTIHPDGH